MNERINKLFGQAMDQSIPETWTTLTHSQLSILKDKFAELLIRECIEVIVRNEHATLNIDNFTNEKAQGIQLGLEFATIDIAEHFGIEE